MITDLRGTFLLNNGIPMPYFGLGVFESAEGDETVNAVRWALEAGYRHIDTASLYMNESSVGKAIAGSGIQRKEIFITTKVWNSEQGHQKTQEAFYRSLEKLHTDYIDLYLIHWPVKEKYIETWQVLEELYSKKLARAIGVSNFLQHQLEDLLKHAEITPMVNQVEFHPYLVQPDLVDYCQKKNIQFEAWSPILKGRVNDIPVIQEIALKYGKTPVQVVLRWDLQKGIITIPKSSHRERIISNADIFNFELSKEEILKIDSLDRYSRIGADPDNFNF